MKTPFLSRFHSGRFSSITTKIFLAYGSIIMILIILAASLYYVTAYNAFMESSVKTSAQLSKIVSRQFDQYFSQINSIQKKILESESIRDYIFDDASKRDFNYDRSFQKTLYMLTGYDFPFYHMNILNLEDNTLITFGYRYFYSPYQEEEDTREAVIEPAMALQGSMLIVPPEKGKLYNLDKDTPTLSLVRSFPRYTDSLSDPRGIIEIQLRYSDLEDLIQETMISYNNQTESVVIFNDHQELIYPLDLSGQSLNYYTHLEAESGKACRNPLTGDRELITSYTSSDTGFTFLLITPEAVLMESTLFFRNVSFLIAGVSLLLLITITYRVARTISSPIVELKNRISQLKLDSLTDEPDYTPESGLNELEMLNEAYKHMQLRLKDSLDDIVSSRTLSIHSQLMALQAQMDSHFLYNTLTVISIIAEENEDWQASEMCLKLTRMLRYITDSDSKYITFETELTYTRNYTDLMSIRFGDQISFDYQTDSSLQSIEVPRLIIQPLVENCVKYSRNAEKKLLISIRTHRDGAFWYVSITDNGSGFSEEALAAIYEKIETFNQIIHYPELGINGMGVANIYLRLKLYYGDNFIFRIQNLASGSSITIGGALHADE